MFISVLNEKNIKSKRKNTKNTQQTQPSSLSCILQAVISEASQSSLPLQLYQAPTCKQNSHTPSRSEPENNTAMGLHMQCKEKYLPLSEAQNMHCCYGSNIGHPAHISCSSVVNKNWNVSE